MAQRQTERDTYGGERRWQEGAGESWTSLERGGAPSAGGDRLTDPESARWFGADETDESRRGVVRRITDELGLTRPGPKGYKRSDERIREDLCDRLWHAHHLVVEDVSVDVKEGVITLEGTVPERRMKHEIEDIAASCRGVNDVENRIRVARGGEFVAGGV